MDFFNFFGIFEYEEVFINSMTDQELKTKKAELKALRIEKEKLNIDAKIEREKVHIKKLTEAAAEAAKFSSLI